MVQVILNINNIARKGVEPILEVIVHYPKQESDKQALRQKVSEVQAEAVTKYSSKLTCPLEQKRKLVQAIQEKTRNGQKN